MRSKFYFICFLLLCQSLWGQTYFGKNKIQYHRFKWHVLSTEHFDIYFYPEMENLAEIGAAYAESAYDYLQNRLNHNIPRRIPLVFYSTHFHFEETNTLPYMVSEGIAGFFEHIKGRVVIPCDGALPDFNKTIQHELVHVFQQSIVQRALKDHRQNVYKSLPLWFTEGMAEYWSEVWDADAEMILRDGILNHSFVPIQEIYRIQGTYLMYKEGQSFVRYLSKRYGEGILLRLMKNIWKADFFSEVFELTVGEKMEAVGEDWQYALQKRYYPLMAKKDLVRRAARPMTRAGYNNLPCVRQGDEPELYFVANRDGYPGIYSQKWSDGPKAKARRIVKSEWAENVESFHLMNSRIDVNNSGLLVFTAKAEGRDRLNIVATQSGALLESVEFDSLITLFSPAWSPDESEIAFTGLDLTGRSDLYLYHLKRKKLTRLTHDYFDDRDPCWSPEGRFLAFSSDRSGSGKSGSIKNIYRIDVATHEILRLTQGRFEDTQPAWSPDGHQLAFVSDRDGVPNLWLASLKTPSGPAQLAQLTEMVTGAFYPSWGGENQLVFAGFDRFSFQIYALDHVQPDSLQFQNQAYSHAALPPVRPRLTGAVQSGRKAYKKKFSLDFAQSQVVQDPIYGTGGGGQFFISDLLGDEYYHCLVYNNARSSSSLIDGFNLAVTRVDLSHRLNYSLGLYRLAGRYYNRYEGYFYSERIGGMASLSYPLNKFERIETSVNARRFTKDRYTHESPIEAFLLSNYLSYTRDNALWGATGPVDGTRFNLTLGNTVDVQNAQVHFTTVMLDYRKYTRLTSRITHAVRCWGQWNEGKEALPFTMGGSWDLRGYQLWSIWGTKLAFVSNEIRFPLLDVLYLRFPFFGLGFQYIQGALFVDAGNAWDDDFGRLKGSFGLGARMRFGGYMVLRLDVGRRTDFQSIEPNTFTQFFFGWDF